MIGSEVFLCQIHSFRVTESIFSSMALYVIIKGVIPCMGTSPGRACAHSKQSKSKSCLHFVFDHKINNECVYMDPLNAIIMRFWQYCD